MYPTDKCHLCKGKLITWSNLEAMQCKKNHYTVWNDGTISIKINDILFEFYSKVDNSTINCQIFIKPKTTATYRLPEWVYVDQESYLQVLDRIKKLEMFK